MKINILGDVHLGRVFKNGVPLHRRGEREKSIFDQFCLELQTDCDVLIQVGDIFDKHRVDLNVVLDTSIAIGVYAKAQPQKQFYFLRGNHDASRDMEKVSSFDVLRHLCAGNSNVFFITDKPTYVVLDPETTILMLPWHPVKSSVEMISTCLGPAEIVVGHWDHMVVKDDHNMIPLDHLKQLTKCVASGHDHVARVYKHEKMVVNIVGSMQPLTHAEDPNGNLYITRTLAEFSALDPGDYRNKCVRILLADGELPPSDVDCLQLTFKKVGQDEGLEVDFDDAFDMNKLFDEVTTGLDADTIEALNAKWQEVRHA